MPRPNNFFRTLAGVPVLYDRENSGDYGVRGIAINFHVPEEFEDTLDACFNDLWHICPLGRAQTILSAGTYSNRPPSQHARGRAMDIDAILWTQRRFVTLAYPQDEVFYLAVESVLRRHFDYVLTYLYNTAHHDHFHVDKTGRVGFGTSQTKVLYLQAYCRHVLGVPVGIDGAWGPNTEEGLEHAQEVLGVNGDLRQVERWRAFLESAAEHAFANALSAADTANVEANTARLAHLIEDGMAEDGRRKDALAALEQLTGQLEAADVRALDGPGWQPQWACCGLLEGEEQGEAGAAAATAEGEVPASKAGRQLVRVLAWDDELLRKEAVEIEEGGATAAEAGWHRRFGGREWRYDERGVYIRDFAGGNEPLRTAGQPVTCRRVWELFEDEIRSAAARFNVSSALILMTIATEAAYWRPVGFTGSRTFYWEPNVWNRDVTPNFRGDYSAGPMQTLATTARWIIRAQNLPYNPFQVAPAYQQRPQPAPVSHPLYDADTNITIGTAEIKHRWGTSGDDPILVAACFNAGGLYESLANAWHLRTTHDHLDRAARWYGDACAVLAEQGAHVGPAEAGMVITSDEKPRRAKRKSGNANL